MSTQTPPSASLWDKAVIVAAILRALLTGISTLLLSPFRGSSGAKSVSKHVKLAMSRKFIECMTIAQSQYMIPPLDSVYPAFAKQKGFKPQSVDMGGGLKGYWIGDSGSRDVLIWFHGGGYTVPAEQGHLEFALSIVETAKAAGKNLAILFPTYTLAPQAVYPRQLEQGVESLRYVLKEMGRKPGDVILGGDSAGANLALSILSHILHPHPTAIPRLSLPVPLKGAIFLAPWWSFATDLPSFNANKEKDSVSKYIGDLWSQNFLGGKQRDEYNEPFRAERGWWESGGDGGRGLRDVVEGIFVTAGLDECLVDSIRIMAGRLEKSHPNTHTLLALHEYHDQPVLSALSPAVGEQADGIRSWVVSKL